MIIIYRGCKPFLPLAACHLHLHFKTPESVTPPTSWCKHIKVPLSVVGVDSKGHIICGLITGRHGDIFERALLGIAELFDIHLSVINVDQLVLNCIAPWSIFYIKLAIANYYPGYQGKFFDTELRPILKESLAMKE